MHVNSNAGAGQGRGMSEQECVQKCMDKYPECVAVDYRSWDRDCYLHTARTSKDMQWNNCCNRYSVFCEGTYSGAMSLLRTRDHDFLLPVVPFEFNKKNFIVRTSYIITFNMSLLILCCLTFILYKLFYIVQCRM